MSKKENSIIEKYKIKVQSNLHSICVCSLMTSLHIVFPIVRILNHLGSVHLITEDKATLALNSICSSNFVIDNVTISVVEGLAMLDVDDFRDKEFDFIILVINEFVPNIVGLNIDQYILLDKIEYYKLQFDSVELKNKLIFSSIEINKIPIKDRVQVKANRFINEELVVAPSFTKFQDYLYKLMETYDYNVRVPPIIVRYLQKIFENLLGFKKNEIQTLLRLEFQSYDNID